MSALDLATHNSMKNYVAVIDIGSNSVRLVVYSGIERVPDTVFNEKVLCGLGAAIGDTGGMGKPEMDHAVMTLKRYRVLCAQMGVSDIQVVATAAVRDAKNGTAFVTQVKNTAGFDIRVIDGSEEGRLSALGVISGEPSATGIMGDLGGGSLELSYVHDHGVFERVSLPMGPLRLISRFGKDQKAMKHHIRQELSQIDWLQKAKGKQLYLVGGAWRNIAKLMMHEKAAPLPILHGFKARHNEMSSYCSRISRLRPKDLPNTNLVPSRRRNVLPVAALILRETIKALGVKQTVVSSYGLREGLIYDQLPEAQQKWDPFLYSCRMMSLERCRFTEHAELIYNWTRPLFTKSAPRDNDAQHRLHMAVCLLSDIAWRGHPDYRAVKAVEAVLHGYFVGISHKGRAFLAVAMNGAYGAPFDAPYVSKVLQLLSVSQIMEARVLGACLRLAQRLSGGATSGLEDSRLRKTQTSLYLELSSDKKDLANDIVESRLRQLVQLLGRRAKIKFVEELSEK